jgi:nucleotide-binding universal stress UspA family protein
MGLAAVLVAALLCACSRIDERMQGANLLPSAAVAFGQEATGESIRRLRKLGANTLALVPFLQQSSTDSVSIEPAGGMDQQGLRRAIRWAQALNMRVVLKPQILVPGSWAGEIAPPDWEPWFVQYGTYLEELARLAAEEEVEMLVIGTELNQSVHQPQWVELIQRLRQVYPGQLAYVAHGVAGLREFAFWERLDAAGVTLFPALGEDAGQAAQQIRATLQDLREVARALPVPVWVAEVGIASRNRATLRPWAWQDLTEEEQQVDLSLQAQVLELWLKALAVDWLDGVLVWAWSSDPAAGGADDNGFTPQNKPAQRVLACRWSGRCR